MHPLSARLGEELLLCGAACDRGPPQVSCDLHASQVQLLTVHICTCCHATSFVCAYSRNQKSFTSDSFFPHLLCTALQADWQGAGTSAEGSCPAVSACMKLCLASGLAASMDLDLVAHVFKLPWKAARMDTFAIAVPCTGPCSAAPSMVQTGALPAQATWAKGCFQ